MKVVVLGDVHFGVGYSIGKTDKNRRLNSRLLDFSNTFDHVIDYMIANDVSHFVITGDIFEYRRPQASELSIFAEKIQRLEENNISTYIVAGNHDLIIDQRTTTVDLFQKLKLSRTFVYSDIDSVTCGTDEHALNLVFVPYRTKSILGCQTNKEAVDIVSERIDYEMEKFSYGKSVAIGHFMFKETMLGSLAIERNSDEVVLPIEMFNNFSAAVVGHIHPHQILQKDPLIVYLGSMDCKDFGESEFNKYFLLIDNTKEDVVFQFEKLPIRRLFDITFDKSSCSTQEELMSELKSDLFDYNDSNPLVNSIVRLNLFLNDRVVYNFDKDIVRNFLKSEFKISHCVNIIVSIMSHRQLRKATITEKKDPIDSFGEYMSDILVNESDEVKARMLEFGTKIITGGKL
jgi:DNA repair exonuclease SbcCD nuclease subunit